MLSKERASLCLTLDVFHFAKTLVTDESRGASGYGTPYSSVAVKDGAPAVSIWSSSNRRIN
jgi:hypothetical protein